MVQQTITVPNYLELQAIINKLALNIHPSELHGAVSGFLCVGANDDAAAYIQELIENKNVAELESEIRNLVNLLTVVHKQLSTLTFDFHLLLPDDDMPLADRAKAMSFWCHGFSDSFLESGADISKFKTDEARDAFYHITEVSQLDYDSLSISEADEKAFFELYEYVRMAVLMMHTELQTDAISATQGSNNNTVH